MINVDFMVLTPGRSQRCVKAMLGVPRLGETVVLNSVDWGVVEAVRWFSGEPGDPYVEVHLIHPHLKKASNLSPCSVVSGEE